MSKPTPTSSDHQTLITLNEADRIAFLIRKDVVYFDKRLFAIQRSTSTRFRILQPINEFLRKHSKLYYKWRIDPSYYYDNWDDEAFAIQRSTRTTIKPLQGLHEKIRLRSSWYYKWHIRPQASQIHWAVLALYTIAIVIGVTLGALGGQHKSTKAAVTNCTWTNGGGTNNWSTAANWSCGAVPDNTYNVIFDGAVSNAPIAIDVAATAASFTAKGTNLPTTGDVAYTGTITANQNLTLDTTNAGTGSYYLGSGTYVANATTITVPGNWKSLRNTFICGTSTIILTNSGTIDTSSGTTWDADSIYNLTAAANGKTTTLGSYMYIGGVLTLGSTGTYTGTFTDLNGSGTPLVTGGSSIVGYIEYNGLTATNVASTTYNVLQFKGGNGNTFTAAGPITVGGTGGGTTMNQGTGNGVTFDTGGYSFTSPNLVIGNTSSSYGDIFKATGSGTVTISGNTTINQPTSGHVNFIDLSTYSGTFYVGGNWVNNDSLTAGTTSTINFNGSGTQTLNSGGVTSIKTFYNLTHSGTGTLQLLTNAYEVDGTFSQTAGTFNANALAQTYKGNFALSSGTTYTKGSTVTFAGTTSYSDANTAPQNIGAVTLNGTSLTITSGTMATDTITVTTGSFIQTAGNVTTTGAVSVAAGKNWTNNGTGDVTLGGNVTNAGTVTFNGNESATGGADPISILSTTTAARTWTLSGAGTFSFTNISASYQTGAAPITATSSNDGGNNSNWTFATNRVISGSLYDAIGGSKITAAKTIKVSVNGAAASSTTSSSGDYTLTLGGDLAVNDIVSVFVSGDTVKASAITKTSVAASGINIDLFQSYTVLRHEGTIASTGNTAVLSIADNVSDSDLLVTVSAMDDSATFIQGVYIMNNKTYTPSANAKLTTGNWANYGTLTPGANTVTFSAGSGTQTVFSSDTGTGVGTGKAFYNLTHSGAGTLQLTSNLDVNGILTNSSGPLDFNSLNIFASGNVTMTGSTITGTGNSTLTFDGAAGQTFTTAGLTYNNITLNNTGTAGVNERITVSGNLDINGALTITDGSLYLVTSNPNVNTAGNVTIAALGLVNKGTGTWTFDGTTTFTDLEATKSNIGPTVVNGTSVTLASSMTVDTMTVTSGTLNLGTAGYTLKLANNGATANVLSVAGTLTVGTSTVQYAAVNSGGNVNILAIPYSSLQFTPVSGSESYDMTGFLVKHQTT